MLRETVSKPQAYTWTDYLTRFNEVFFTTYLLRGASCVVHPLPLLPFHSVNNNLVICNAYNYDQAISSKQTSIYTLDKIEAIETELAFSVPELLILLDCGGVTKNRSFAEEHESISAGVKVVKSTRFGGDSRIFFENRIKVPVLGSSASKNSSEEEDSLSSLLLLVVVVLLLLFPVLLSPPRDMMIDGYQQGDYMFFLCFPLSLPPSYSNRGEHALYYLLLIL